MRLLTSRLSLDPLTVADADEMVGVLADPRLYAFTGGEPPTIEQLRGDYRAMIAGPDDPSDTAWHNWIVRRLDDGRAVGTVQATVALHRRSADIAWVIGVPWQGQGYASEAARALVDWLGAGGITTVTAHVHPDHAASAVVAVRAGLVPTGEVEGGEQVWRRELSAGQHRPDRR